MDDIDGTSGNTHPAPVTLITDRTDPVVVGAVARLVGDLQVVPLGHDLPNPLPTRAVVAVADPGKTVAILDGYSTAAPPGSCVQVALTPEAGPSPQVMESLERFDASSIVPAGAVTLVTLTPAAQRPGTAARWATRISGGGPTAAQDHRPAVAPPKGGRPTNTEATVRRQRSLRAVVIRTVSRPRLLALLSLLVIVGVVGLSLVTFSGDLAAVALVALMCLLLLGTAAAALLGYRRTASTASAVRRQASQLRQWDSRLRALQDDFGRLRASVAGGTATSAQAALATRELLDELEEQGNPRVRIGELSGNVASLASRLAAVETTTSDTLTRVGEGVRQWDVTRLHDDLLNEQQALAQLLARHQPSGPLPPVAGWAMNPTGLLWLVDHVERTRPGVVLEVGSGTSTFWLATALRRVGSGRLVSVEHDPDFATHTVQLLERHGLRDWADVRVCPLVEVPTAHGTQRWYDLDLDSVGTVDLLVVDGPPSTTGPHARYPALPILAERFGDSVTIVLDDTGRRDEREVLELWLDDDPGLENLGEVARGVVALRRRQAVQRRRR